MDNGTLTLASKELSITLSSISTSSSLTRRKRSTPRFSSALNDLRLFLLIGVIEVLNDELLVFIDLLNFDIGVDCCYKKTHLYLKKC